MQSYVHLEISNHDGNKGNGIRKREPFLVIFAISKCMYLCTESSYFNLLFSFILIFSYINFVSGFKSLILDNQQ